jgi:hypothetical protein
MKGAIELIESWKPGSSIFVTYHWYDFWEDTRREREREYVLSEKMR